MKLFGVFFIVYLTIIFVVIYKNSKRNRKHRDNLGRLWADIYDSRAF